MNLQQYLIALHVAEGLTNMNQKVTTKKIKEYSIFNVSGSILEVDKDILKDFGLMYGRIGLDSDDCIISIEG